MEVGPLGEFALIDRLIQRLGSGSGVVLGAGDDAAALVPSPGMVLLATCDSQVEGRHFLRPRISPEQLGRRLAAVNLSDIAAMGGRPRWGLVSLALPAATEVAYVEALYSGLTAELQRFGAAVVGGNVTGAATLLLDLTLLGEAAPEELLRRSGARPGDAVLVTGSLGESAAGRALLDAGTAACLDAGDALARHLAPQPRVAAGRAIARSRLASAAIDVSDGFAQDLGHICAASGAGVEIEAEALPVSQGTRAIAASLGLDALELALTGGEDYELICTAPPEAAAELAARVAAEGGVTLSRVGTILAAEAGRGLRLADGSLVPLHGGWQHFGSSRTAP